MAVLLAEERRNLSFIKFPPESRKNFILGHNGLRNRMAWRPDKTASNMNLIHWDQEMVLKAKFWILTCFTTKEPPKFCTVAQFPGVNRMQLERLKIGWEFSSIRLWFSPYRTTTDREIDFLTRPSTFTQLIWATVEVFGCTLAEIDQDFFVIVCVYDPPGNRIRERVYETGIPCSECENTEACSAVFTGLCGVDMSGADRKSPNLWVFSSFGTICSLIAVHWRILLQMTSN
ncbi:cysteine-rich venom protein-like [Phlebotomus argentipes]|uniref:cysteine-rich venom protein-like n=1 Tax=Phlebotomus argentipes TaxID=94469 RepID=UPI0028930527|nr:cysteine-rich venom protein-like [Phlebotomus argentipes]